MSDFPVSIKLKAIDRISRVTQRATKGLERLKRVTKRLSNHTKLLTDKTKRLRMAMSKVGSGARKVGQNLTTRVTAPLAIAGGFMIKAAADFEQGMNRVQALSGATGDQFDVMRNKAKELGATTKFSATEAADAMGFLAQAGFDAGQITGSIEPTLQLAASANIDLAESADIVSNVLTGMKLKVEDLGRANDVLVNTFTSTNVDLVQLGASFRKVGPIAATMGISIEETAAAIGLLGNAGIQAEEAGTGLRNVLINIAKPSNEAKRALAKLGIPKSQLIDSQGNVKSLTALMEAFSKSGANAADLTAIFGKRAGPQFAALLGQGIEAFKKQVEISKKSGTTARIAEVQNKGAAGAMRGLKSAVEGLAIAVADSGVLEFFTNMVKKITEFTRNISKANPELLKIGAIIGAVAAAIGPLLIGFGFMVMGLKPLVALFPFVIAGFKTLFALMIANPIGLTVTAIAALVAGIVLLVKHWDTVKEVTMKTWDAVKRSAGKAIDFILDKMKFLTDSAPFKFLKGFFGGEGKSSGGGVLGFSGFGSLSDSAKDRRERLGGAPGTEKNLAPPGGSKRGTTSVQRQEKTASVTLDFKNVPKGVTVKQQGTNFGDGIDLSLGFSEGVV